MRTDPARAARRSRRGLLAGGGAAALGVLAPAVVGCVLPGQGTPEPSGGAAPGAVQVLTFNNPLFQQPKDELLAAFTQVEPGVRPDLVLFPGQINEFREKMLSIYAGGDVPDAQWIHPSITSLLATKRLARPLDDLARRDKDTQLTDFYPGLLEFLRWKGTTYGLPFYSSGYALAFNRGLFDRLGVPQPDRLEREGRWGWEAYVSTLRGLTRGAPGEPERTIGSDGLAMALDWVSAWLWRNGGDVFSKDLKRCLLAEPAALEAIQGAADLHLRHSVVNFGPHQADFAGGFGSGRIGLKEIGKEATAPDRPGSLSKLPLDLGLAPVYKGKAGRVNRGVALAFGAAQGGPNGDAGWRWVRFMAGPQAQAIMLAKKSALPIRPRFTQLPEYAQSTESWESKEVWLDSVATSRALTQPASYDQIARLWQQAWTDILAQKAPVKSLVEGVVRQADELLAQEPAS